MGEIVKCEKCGKVKKLYNKTKFFNCCATRQLIANHVLKETQPLKVPETPNLEGGRIDDKWGNIGLPAPILEEKEPLKIQKLERPVEVPKKEWKYRCGACKSPFDELKIVGTGKFCPICNEELN